MATRRESGLDSCRSGVACLRSWTSALRPNPLARSSGICADFAGFGILRGGRYSTNATLARSIDRLEEVELREPEEDVEIRLLDSRFRPLTTITRSSRLPPPVLLNEGEVQIHSIARNRWQFVENTWTGERRVLAVASSTCVPHADSMPGNLLFVLGCDRQPGGRWYRILHGDGKVVLKGWSFSSELGQTAGGNVGRNAFAIRIVEAPDSRSLQSVFRPSDLKSSHVAVYQATNGHRIFSIGVRDLVPAVQTFAISPREDQMAILKAGEIVFYRVSVAE